MPQIGERRTSPDGKQQAEFDGKGWSLVSNPVHAQPQDSASEGPFEMHHARSGESPLMAGATELGRTAVEAGKGILQSPMDMLHGLMGLPGQAASAVGELVKDPSLLMEAPRAAAQTVGAIADPATNPRDMGSLLGQTLIGEALPGAMKAGADAIPSVRGLVGKGVSSVGRGMEATGTHPFVKSLKPFGVEALPVGLEYGGKGLQKAGDVIQHGRKPAIDPYMANKGRVSSEVPYRASEPTGVDGLNSPAPEPQVPASLQSLIEQGRTAPNISGHVPGSEFAQSAAGVENSGLEPHMPNESGHVDAYGPGAMDLPASIRSLVEGNSTPPSEFPAGQGANGNPAAAGELATDGAQRFMQDEFARNQGTAAEEHGAGKPLVDMEALHAQMPEMVRALAEKVGLASDSRFPADPIHDLGELGDYGQSTRASVPDLMDAYQKSTAGPAAPFEMDGQQYAADESGSHVAIPDSVAALTGKPRVRMSSSGYPAEWDSIEAEPEAVGAGAGRRRSTKSYKDRGYTTRDGE